MQKCLFPTFFRQIKFLHTTNILRVSDYYHILGIPKTADIKSIKKAYYEKCKIYHPDARINQSSSSHINPGESERIAESFRKVAEAYECLSDVEKRKDYDRQLLNDSFINQSSPFQDSANYRYHQDSNQKSNNNSNNYQGQNYDRTHWEQRYAQQMRAQQQEFTDFINKKSPFFGNTFSHPLSNWWISRIQKSLREEFESAKRGGDNRIPNKEEYSWRYEKPSESYGNRSYFDDLYEEINSASNRNNSTQSSQGKGKTNQQQTSSSYYTRPPENFYSYRYTIDPDTALKQFSFINMLIRMFGIFFIFMIVSILANSSFEDPYDFIPKNDNPNNDTFYENNPFTNKKKKND